MRLYNGALYNKAKDIFMKTFNEEAEKRRVEVTISGQNAT